VSPLGREKDPSGLFHGVQTTATSPTRVRARLSRT
jgi:hypothetical protein